MSLSIFKERYIVGMLDIMSHNTIGKIFFSCLNKEQPISFP